MVDRARDLVSDPGIAFEVGDGSTLRPVGDARADFVIAHTVLQHLPTRSAIASYLEDAARVLKPGGVLAAQWNNVPHPVLFELRGVSWRVRRRLGWKSMSDVRYSAPFIGTPLTG